MKNQEPSKPTGNLEELFRHHLAEAAVPPRPHVWEQVDNALLLAQNQTYRHRLRVTRWVAAASLLLATLAGTGWWIQQDGRRDRAAGAAGREQPAATATREAPRAGNPPAATARTARPTGPAPDMSDTAIAPSAAGVAATTTASAPGQSETESPVAPAVAQAPTSRSAPLGASRRPMPKITLALLPPRAATRTAGAARAGRTRAGVAGLVAVADVRQGRRRQIAVSRPERRPTATTQSLLAASGAAQSGRKATPDTHVSRHNSAADATTSATTGATTPPNREAVTAAAAAAADATTASRPAGQPDAAAASPVISPAINPAASLAASTTDSWDSPAAIAALSGRAVAVRPQPEPASLLAMRLLPTSAVVLPESPANASWLWQVGLAYSAGLFASNVDFSRPSADYNSALGINSPALTRAAAAEYQSREQPGLSQRLRLRLSRPLRGHWCLGSGFEIAQQQSRSTTSYHFTGEQIPDLSQSAGSGPARSTQARYRTAGLPLELSYANPAKPGWSLYGRLGVAISALLSVRTEVAGVAEATRAYGLFAPTSPYRALLGTAHGAAGVRLRPTGHAYTLHLGPVVEGGLWSLNADPAQSLLRQSRPYSFGLEAGVEFGRSRPKL